MTSIQRSTDCKNSPKNLFAENAALALETGGAQINVFADDVTWWRGEHCVAESAAKLQSQLASTEPPRSVAVHHAITHGKVGVANGTTVTASGDTVHFCHAFEFTSSKAEKIAMVRSYLA